MNTTKVLNTNYLHKANLNLKKELNEILKFIPNITKNSVPELVLQELENILSSIKNEIHSYSSSTENKNYLEAILS